MVENSKFEYFPIVRFELGTAGGWLCGQPPFGFQRFRENAIRRNHSGFSGSLIVGVLFFRFRKT